MSLEELVDLKSAAQNKGKGKATSRDLFFVREIVAQTSGRIHGCPLSVCWARLSSHRFSEVVDNKYTHARLFTVFLDDQLQPIGRVQAFCFAFSGFLLNTK